MCVCGIHPSFRAAMLKRFLTYPLYTLIELEHGAALTIGFQAPATRTNTAH